MKAIVLLVLAVSAAVGSASTLAPAAEVPRCHAGRLHLGAGFYGEAAIQFTQTLTFRNIASRSCRLAGWPRVRVTGPPGRALPTTVRRVVQGPPGARPFKEVLLRPAGAASFDLYGADWNAGADRPCPTTSALLVAPPGASAWLRPRIRLPDCGLLFVAPVVAGTRDRLAWSRVWRG